MIYSNSRKLALSGWLKKNNLLEYSTPLKLQKFLLFYEAFSKVDGEEPDFSHLRGYQRGPVFSNVWGDYTKERMEFDKMAQETYSSERDLINESRAKKCAFIVGTLSETELSEFTHKMNLWKAKEKRILSGEHQVDLDESDFNQHDIEMMKLLDKMYPDNVINNCEIININNYYFVFRNKDVKKLTERHFDTLSLLCEEEELYNPIYVEIDDEGRLVVD